MKQGGSAGYAKQSIMRRKRKVGGGFYGDLSAYSNDFRARQMRRKPTRAEAALETALSERFAGTHTEFVHQYMIGPYIADFCVRGLIVEVDGATHAERKEYDDRRTAYLRNRGYRVLRFTNAEVFQDAARCADVVATQTGPHEVRERGVVKVTICPPGSAVHDKPRLKRDTELRFVR